MRVRYGMVHGRFQPFHTGHLHYTLEALRRSEHLIIGITNPDPSETQVEETDAQRHTPEANPFTFFERQRMIRAALVDEAVELSCVSIVPFPIHTPQRWQYYCPKETVQFIRVFSEWGKEKVARFQEAGWPVEILDSRRTQAGKRQCRPSLLNRRTRLGATPTARCGRRTEADWCSDSTRPTRAAGSTHSPVSSG